MTLLPLHLTLAALGLERLTWLQAGLVFAVLAVPTIWLARKALEPLGPRRRWIALGARLVVLALAVLILAGVRSERKNDTVEVMVVRDVSASARQSTDDTAGQSLSRQIGQWVASVSTDEAGKEPDDRVGIVSFDASAYVDQMPNNLPQAIGSVASAVNRGQTGTDVAEALNLALATFSPDSRRRLLLVWDGNSTEGDLDAAIARAKQAGVPIDVMPLEWSAGNEVYLDDLYAPTWRREGEPFTLEVILTNTSAFETPGTLRVEQEGRPLDLDPTQPGVQAGRPVILSPGRNKELVIVDPLPGERANVRRFRATFEPERRRVNGQLQAVGDGLVDNNSASAFTFVRGKGTVLYVDNVRDNAGDPLAEALASEQVAVQRVGIGGFPTNLVDLQAFDAVILANVPRGAGGLTAPQDAALARYVHDTAGGLVMIGGPDTFGAGGWRGSATEAVLPLDMDVPSRRQIPKGALCLVMHSTEMPQGNYWAEQCALAAVEVLNRDDEVGVLSYDWTSGKSLWDYPLQPKGNGSVVAAAIRNIELGDMPDFDDALTLALLGDGQNPGLEMSDARQKHVIIISDMDPSPPSGRLLQRYKDAQVSISTVQVAGHGSPLQAVAKNLAEETGGTAYGPIEQDPSQLPQIFIKEATIVRRTLIKEDSNGIPVAETTDAAGSELMRGINPADTGPVFGMVLTTRKPSPLVEMPLLASEQQDPLFAHWTAGLGKSAAWTSDAHNRWAAPFTGSAAYDKFWAQVVRGVSRAPQSGDYEVTTTVENGRGRIVVEAVGEDARFKSRLSVAGSVLSPDGDGQPVTLVQTRPGTYEAEFDARDEGSYVVALNAAGPEGSSALRGGTSVNGTDELLDLQSDAAAVRRVAEETGGRVLPAFGELSEETSLFARRFTDATGAERTLPEVTSPLPIWDWLVPLLIALVLIDVAIRRIAWDRELVQLVADKAGAGVRGFTVTTRQDRDAGTLDALRQRRPAEATRTAKFEATEPAPDDDLTTRLRGPSRSAPSSKASPSASPDEGGGISSLMEAKRRAREKLEEGRDDE
ncbi:MAG: VWA domain-containing protein [Planctomycetota bacterium]